MKKAKTLIITGALLVIGWLLYILFQNDIQVIGNQLATSAGVVVAEPVVPFEIQGGFVEYVEDGAETTVGESYPTLPSVNATLEIPRVGIVGKVLDGSDETLLDRGFWHYPSASPFASGGNVVVIGHRFLKLPPHRDTFYHLNRVRPGDDIMIKTTEQTFTYRAREQKIVKTTDVYILQQTLNPQLTLITCHPLWTSAERLVIIADRVGE